MSVWDRCGYVEKLKRLWMSHTASQIGEMLGVTRNAVIGKAAREKLPAKPGGTNQRTRVIDPDRRKRLSAQGASRSGDNLRRRNPLDGDGITSIAPVVSDPPRELQIPLIKLKPHHCRAPLGEPTMFCGRTKVKGSAYCAEHYGRFERPTPRQAFNTEWSADRKVAHAARMRARNLKIKAAQAKA